jgi:glutathione S-transferase
MPRVFYMPRTRSTRVLWMLEEIGKPYDAVQVARDDRRSPEHLARHPLGRVPVVELDDGSHLFESAAICLQLADLYPDAGLIPPVGSQERGLVYQWVLFAVNELEGPLFRWRQELRDNPSDTPSRQRFAHAARAAEDAIGAGPWLLGTTSPSRTSCASASSVAHTHTSSSQTGQDCRHTSSAVKHGQPLPRHRHDSPVTLVPSRARANGVVSAVYQPST